MMMTACAAAYWATVVIKRKETREKVCGLCLNANSCIAY